MQPQEIIQTILTFEDAIFSAKKWQITEQEAISIFYHGQFPRENFGGNEIKVFLNTVRLDNGYANQLKPAFHAIQEFIDILGSLEDGIKNYPDAKLDIQSLRELIAQADEGLENLAENLD
ncbi:MAG: hypothetical protein ACOVQ7_15740 [Limnoraphis robusta]